MKRVIFLASALFLFLFNQNSYTQIVGFYPPADTIGIGFGCTPPFIVCSVSPDLLGTDSIIVNPGWNTMMAVKDGLSWNFIDYCFFLVEDSLDKFEYEVWYHPQSFTPILVTFDSSFECYDLFFDLQLIVKEQNIVIDSLSQLFEAKVGLSIEEENDLFLSHKFKLFQNYPNPFNPVTTISFFLPKASPVKVEIFDVVGNRIETLLNLNKSAGAHEVQFDGSSLSSGIYLYRIQTGQFVDMKKMVLMK